MIRSCAMRPFTHAFFLLSLFFFRRGRVPSAAHCVRSVQEGVQASALRCNIQKVKDNVHAAVFCSACRCALIVDLYEVVFNFSESAAGATA